MAWYLVFHVLGLVVWMGALLDLTRILGYHVKEDLNVQERLSFMEFRIFFFVSTPGLIITLIFGILMFFEAGGTAQYFQHNLWFHVKLGLVLLLFAIHFFVGKQVLKLKAQPQKIKPAKFKALHGITALTMTIIIILVFVKPF